MRCLLSSAPVTDEPAQLPGLLVFGGGAMAQAIVRAALDRRVLSPLRITLCEPGAAKRELFDSWGLPPESTTADHAEACLRAAPGTPILLAVKPQSFLGAFPPGAGGAPIAALGDTLRPLLTDPDRPILSIMAGVRRSTIADRLNIRGRSVIRAMPNVAARVGLSMSALCAGEDADPEDLSAALTLFGSIGRTLLIEEELFDAFTALAGSGPAYLFLLAEAMTEAGARAGFSPEASDLIVRETLLGAASLLRADDRSAEALRGSVTSRGGTTAAALGVLEEAGMVETVVRAILAARDRGREMGA